MSSKDYAIIRPEGIQPMFMAKILQERLSHFQINGQLASKIKSSFFRLILYVSEKETTL
jgi:hypothetical protein